MFTYKIPISITTDYVKSFGSPKPYLSAISNAGFTHIHWCHQWNTDFIYNECEISQIKRWLSDFNLNLLDLHGSKGKEKNWVSTYEYERLAGVELVKNRIDMTSRLGSDVVIMHTGDIELLPQLYKSLDEVHSFAMERNVRIALENGDLELIQRVFSDYSADYVGLCYDSGHGNMKPGSLSQLQLMKDRLISVHLHDNDGVTDQHKIPFSGTLNWQKLMSIISESSYKKCVSLEVSIRNSEIEDEFEFLLSVYKSALDLTKMLK